MANKEDILKFLAAESGPITLQQLGEKMGLSTEQFTTQVKRMEKQDPPLVEMNQDKQYFITDEGRKHLAAQNQALPPQGILQQSDNPQAVISQYQKFIQLGQQSGVTNMPLLKATADHVWNGGEYTDLIWVRQALKEADIAPDLANRWTNFWRSFLKKPMTPELSQMIEASQPHPKADQKPVEKGIRSHMLGPDNIPVYVGEGNGDLNEKDAVDLAKIRAMAMARGGARGGDGQAQSPGDMADQLVKIVAAVDQLRGQQAPPVNYVVKPKADGTGFEVATTEPGVPMVIPELKAPQAAKSYFMDQQTREVKELDSSKPNVFFLPAPATPVAQVAGNVVRYLVDKATGTVTPLTGNEPIIIQAAPVQQTVIPFKDKDGNPMTLDIDTYFKLDEHKAKMERDAESHKVKMDFVEKARDFMGKAITAMSRAGGEGK